MRIYPVILAGGASSRLWPASGKAKPKWDLRLFGTAASSGKPRSLLESAWDRARALAPASDCYVVTSVEQAALVRASLPDLPQANLLLEHEARDTSGAVAYAAGVIAARTTVPFGEAVMLVLPGDHVISPMERFSACALAGAQAAVQTGALATIGVIPRKPAICYGYIHRGAKRVALAPQPPSSPDVYEVLQFREKPDLETAQRYVAAGDYYWNGGIFLWTLDALARELKRQLPLHAALFDALRRSQDPAAVTREHYPKLKKLSIDFGIMEHAPAVVTVEADFSWDDIGSWSAVAGHLDRRMDNVLGPGTNLIAVDAKGNFVFAPGKRVALIGVEGLAVIESDNEILVCHLDHDQDVRKASEQAAREKSGG